MMNPVLVAAGVLLFGICAFDMMGILVRMLGGTYPILQIAVLRNLFGVLPALFLLWHARQLSNLTMLLNRKGLLVTLIRSASVALAQLCFYNALTSIEFATATALAFCGPMFLTALSVPLLGHKVGIWRWSAILIGFAGVVTILQPFGEGFSPAMILPVMAAFFYAVSSILVRRFPADVPSAAIQFSQQIVTFVIMLVALVLFQQPAPVDGVSDALLFVLVGIFGGTGVMCLVIAYRLADPGSVSPFEYFGIPISFCLGWLFFSEAPFGDLFPGILLIVVAGITIIFRERIVSRRADTDRRST
mgnify:CR=1 FL=1